MGGESQRHHGEGGSTPIPTGAATGAKKRETEERIGPYGGDDGALEHERTEIDAAETPTIDDRETRAKQRQSSVQ